MDQDQLIDRMNAMQRKQQALRQVTAAMANRADLDVHSFFAEVLKLACQALGAPMAGLHLAGGDPDKLNLVAGVGLDPTWARAWSRLKTTGSTPPAAAYTQGVLKEVANGQAPSGLTGVVSVPVAGISVIIGTLSLLWPKPHGMPLDPDRADFLVSAGNLLGIAIEHAGLVSDMIDRYADILQLKSDLEERNEELAALNHKLEELSVTDGLTALPNRRHLQERLVEEVARAHRLGQPLCVVMADLDFFKRVNDELGHQAGDEALIRFSDWMRAGVRQVDMVGRYGGEEFLALLVNCSLEDGIKVAEKLRSVTAKRSQLAPFDILGGFTVSLGVAQLQSGQDHTAVVAQADQALYRAKEKGRNQVCAAPNHQPT